MIIYETQEELLQQARTSLNVKFDDINKDRRNMKHKGGIGHVVEESIFGYEINSNPEPDIANLGIEIKVTPYHYTKTKLRRAKERLVLGMIDYNKEVDVPFYDSKFWYKNQKLLILFYEHNKTLPKGDWFIDLIHLLEYPEEDLKIIKNDYKIINDKIKAGKAHELSEGDTMYLGACTKGVDSSSVRDQPYSDIKAKKRAYSLKQSYMSYVLNNYVDHTQKNVVDIYKNESLDFETFIINQISKYYNRSIASLANHFDLKLKSKRITNSIIKRILKVNNDEVISEFEKANIEVKAIRVNNKMMPEQHMSFPVTKFMDIYNASNFEDTDFYDTLSEKKFLFVVYQQENNEFILKRVFFWNMPSTDIDIAEQLWISVKAKIEEGITFIDKGKRVNNDLPKSKVNEIIHFRPHAKKSYYRVNSQAKTIIRGDNENYGDILPNGDIMTKQCFWLNKKYLQKIIKKNI